MSIILDYKKLRPFDPRDFVTTKEGNDLFPNLSQDYIGRLLRHGLVDGVRTDSGQWLVRLDSLRSFVEHSAREEMIRKEHVRFERLQEKKLQFLPAPTVLQQLSSGTVFLQSIAILTSGLFVGMALFFGSSTLPTDTNNVAGIAQVFSIMPMMVSTGESEQGLSKMTAEDLAPQVAGDYVEDVYSSKADIELVVLQSEMGQASAEVVIELINHVSHRALVIEPVVLPPPNNL